MRCKLSQPQEGLRVSASCAVQISHPFAAVALITDASLMHGVGDAVVRCRVHGHATLDCAFKFVGGLTLVFFVLSLHAISHFQLFLN